MNSQETNWYIEYDYKIFNILKDPNFNSLIFRHVEMFSNVQAPPPDSDEENKTPQWIAQISQSIMEISTLLYNFFNVEEKLAKDQLLKTKYLAICSVLKIEKEYSGYFFTMSQQFRINRILACCLRLNRFMESIFIILSEIKKNMDKTLLENLDEVYLFMEQRIRQTLEITRQMGDHDLNIILLDMLSLLLRNTGDPTMEKILDNKKERNIIDSILKSNEIYEDFMLGKIDERNRFEGQKQFQIEMSLQEDPNLKRQDSSDNELSD